MLLRSTKRPCGVLNSFIGNRKVSVLYLSATVPYGIQHPGVKAGSSVSKTKQFLLAPTCYFSSISTFQRNRCYRIEGRRFFSTIDSENTNPEEVKKENLEIPRLLHTVALGDLKEVKKLLLQGSSLDETDVRGNTSLLLASHYGKLDMVKYFLCHGSSVHEKSNNGNTSLTYAVQAGHLEIVKYLLSKGSSVDEKLGGWTCLQYAASEGNVDMVKYLVLQGSYVGETDDGGWTSLLLAANGGHLETMKFLIANGSSVDEKSNNGMTCLALAAQGGHHKVVHFLCSLPTTNE